MDETNSLNRRIFVIIGVVIAVMIAYGIVLMKAQVEMSEYYQTQAVKQTATSINVSAARGEIVDRYGREIVKNRLGYAVVFNRAELDKDTENEVIWRLCTLLTKNGETWNDTCQIIVDEYGKASYPPEEEQTSKIKSYISKMQTELMLQSYATAQNCYDTMIENYELQNLSPEVARTIMGVRLEMDLATFSSAYPYTFASDISRDTMQIIKENTALFKGVEINVVPIREYVDGTIAPHMIGNIGPIYAEEYESLKKSGYRMTDYVGKFGIEKTYESYLRGKDGKKKVQRDGDGNIIYEEYTTDATPGNTVVLTLDSDLQSLAQKSLGDCIQGIAKAGAATSTKYDGEDADAGALVVMNVQTFEVLALVTYPSYDLATYAEEYDDLLKNKGKPLYNRALNGVYAPGSTFKVAVALAGLETGTITTKSTYMCNRSYDRLKAEFPTLKLKCLGAHGNIDVTTALSKSCNIFFYNVGYDMGITKLNEYCRQLGLGSATGIGMGESTGCLAGREERLAKEEGWYLADTLTAAIGQNDNRFTPVQLCAYMATIANGGTRYEARLIKTIKSYDYTETVIADTSDNPKILNNLNVKAVNLGNVKKGLLSVTQEGTASAAFSNYGIRVGGKTGTADTTKTSTANAIFIAFAPYDTPEIAICVIGERCGHGSAMTGVARDIFDEYFFSAKTSGYSVQSEGQMVNEGDPPPKDKDKNKNEEEAA